jgi:excinuclease UvrABC nuclease subunit
MIDASGHDDHPKVFGPFRDAYLAETTLELIRRRFHLRSCRESVPSRKCLKGETGACMGPCMNRTPPGVYRAAVRQAVAFLEGDASPMVKRLSGAMQEASNRLDFECASRLRDQIDFTRRFCRRLRFLVGFRRSSLVVHEGRKARLTHVFIQGDGEARRGRLSRKEVERLIARRPAKRSCREDARFVLDRANIVYDWLKRNREHAEHYFLA